MDPGFRRGSSLCAAATEIACHYDYHSYYRAQEEIRPCPVHPIPRPSSSAPATPPAVRSRLPFPPGASPPASTPAAPAPGAAGAAPGGAPARPFPAGVPPPPVPRRSRNADALETLAQSIRDAGHRARAFPGDARSEDDMVALFDRVEAEVGPVEVAVFNIGANVNFPIVETTARVYTKVWEMACLGGFLLGREAAKRMAPRGRGTIIFTGATASLRGGSGFAAFSGAKAALRMLAQSMARELGPQGVHVAHVVID
ncbi:MAG TPA: SDR family NAD(P)-dependent oxidoreductase, partial [Sphingopyxis sp.]|nr:SDR family NAD(P)-dependent oxidoreductase [Sphingopyxis sp.]